MATIKPQTLMAIQRAAETQQQDIAELKVQLSALVGKLPNEDIAKDLATLEPAAPVDLSPVVERLLTVEAKLDMVLAALEQPKGKGK